MKILVFSMTSYSEEIKTRLLASRPGSSVRIVRKDDLINQGSKAVFRTLRKEADYDLFVLALNSCAYVNKRLLLDWFIRLASRKPVLAMDKDGGQYPITWARLALTTLPRLSAEAVLSFRALLGVRRLLADASPLAPFAEPPPSERRVGYLRTSSWFGVKAGGSVGHTTGVINGFLGLGYATRVASSDRLEGISEERHGLSVIGHSRFVNMTIPVTAFAYTFRFAREAERMLRPFRPAFLYQRYSLGNLSGIQLSRRLGIPLILEYNGSEVWMLRNWEKGMPFMDLLEKVELYNLKKASRVVVVSEASRDELLGRGVPAGSIVTVPNGVDVDIYRDALDAEGKAALKRKLRIPGDAAVAGFIGTFGKWHGVEFLAEAIKDVLARAPRKVHFLLIGDGPLMARVKEIVQRDGVGDAVTLTGLIPQTEGPAHLAICDIFLSPHVPNPDGSPFFGSPTKLFEYMAMGKGILAADLEQIGKILSPGLSGDRLRAVRSAADVKGELAVLHKPGDRGSYAEGLLHLLAHPKVSDALGGNARREAHRKYTWKAHVDAILKGESH